jgi:RNA polymerase sigma-70 factor (ECF subfamily)
LNPLSDFATRVNELIPRLRRYARALTGERSAADDLVQDTLERAWTKLHLWRTGSDLRAWLFTIMHNVHVNQVRSKAAAVTLPLDDDLPDSPVRPTQADMLEVRDIDTALKRLPVAQREVLLLVALEHLSYQETADALGIPIGTVMSRLARARERLRLMLSGEAGAASLKVIK